MEPVILGTRGRFIFYLALTALVVGVKFLSPESVDRLEWKFQDMLYEFKSASDVSKDVVIVNIDDLSTRELGAWPWKEEVLADLIAAVGAAKPRSVLIDFSIPDYVGSKVADSGGVADQLYWMNNVTVSYDVVPTDEVDDTVTNPKFLFRNALVTNSDLGRLEKQQALPVRAVALPNSSIADAAKRMGFTYSTIDEDHILRSEPLVMNYQGYYYPSTPLAAASHFLKILPENIIVYGGEGVELGEREIPTTESGEMNLNFPAGEGFNVYSATDILNERTDFKNLAKKLVIITLGSGSQTEFYKTPVAEETPRYLLTAIATDNILRKSYLHRADSQLGLYILALALIGLISAYTLQKISSLYRVIVVAVGIIALANVNFFLFDSFNLMANSIYVAILLVLFLVAGPLMSIDYSFIPFLRPKIEGEEEEDTSSQRGIETRAAVANAIKTMPRPSIVRSQAPAPANSKMNQTVSLDSTMASMEGQDHSQTMASQTMASQTMASQTMASQTMASQTVALTGANEEAATQHIVSKAGAKAEDKTMALGSSDIDASKTVAKTVATTVASSSPVTESADNDCHTPGIINPTDSENTDKKSGEVQENETAMFGDLTSAVVDEPVGEASESANASSEEPHDPSSISLDEEPVDTVVPEEVVKPAPVMISSEAKSGAGPKGDIQQLGRYQIHGVLGKGAMGMVYGGIDPAINRKVALKTIRLDFLHDPEEMEEMKERLFLEAQAAGKLNHPNIVTIYDVGSEGSMQYIAMELIEGQTLEDMIKRGVNFNFKIVARMIYQICQALQYAHDAGIVHRDIKPANLMVLPDYSVKVMDFGIARVESSSMTKTGVAMGTPNYISPEQLQGQKVDGRTDLFSLGIVLYEMLVGTRPFNGDNLTSLIYSIVNTEPEAPSRSNPRIPPLFDHIVGKSLKKDPAERYQRASDISAALNDFVQSFATR